MSRNRPKSIEDMLAALDERVTRLERQRKAVDSESGLYMSLIGGDLGYLQATAGVHGPLASPQTVLPGVWTTIDAWDTTEMLPGSGVFRAGGHFTLAEEGAGWWDVSASAVFSAGEGSLRAACLLVNGSPVSESRRASVPGDLTTADLHWLGWLGACEVELQVLHDSDGPLELHSPGWYSLIRLAS